MEQYWSHIMEALISLGKYIKLKIAGGILLSAYAVFFNLEFATLMQGLILLVTFDLITGVFVAKREGSPIESRKVCKSAFKLLIYGLMVAAFHFVDMAIMTDGLAWNLELGMVAFLTTVEAISILENAGRLGVKTPARLLNQLKKYVDEK